MLLISDVGANAAVGVGVADGESGEGDLTKFEIAGESVVSEEPGRSKAAGPFDVHAARNDIKKVARRKILKRGRMRLHLDINLLTEFLDRFRIKGSTLYVLSNGFPLPLIYFIQCLSR